MCLLMAGCVQNLEPEPEKQNMENSTSQELPQEEELEAIDTAIIISLDCDMRQIILQTSGSGTRYELSYDGKTYFYDEYGQVISATQLESGLIVDLKISIHSGYLKELTKRKDTFVKRDVSEHSINVNKKMFIADGDNYKLPERLVVIIDGKLAEAEDINENDVLTIAGIDRTVMTCIVNKGHGYLKLKSEETFLGGWLEIGNIIKPITENMLLLVPEGDYDMRITYHGRGGILPVTIERDRETKVDVSGLKDEILKTGMVEFKIDPADAKLTINGEEKSTVLPVELEYGVYRISVTKRGYTPVNQYLSVGQEKAEINIYLEESKEASDEDEKKDKESSSGTIDYVLPPNIIPPSPSLEEKSSSSARHFDSSSKSSSSAGDISEENGEEDKEKQDNTKPQLYVNSPSDVEVYCDGSYKGISPLNFVKEPGVHVISLRKDGYVTKSYTITVNDDGEDEYFDFVELVESGVINDEE